MQAVKSETNQDMAGQGETEKRPENPILIGKSHHQNGTPATEQPPYSHHQAHLPRVPPPSQGHMRNYSYPPPPHGHGHHHPPPSMYRPPPPPGYQMPPNLNGYPPYQYPPPYSHHHPHSGPAPAPSNGDGSDEKSSDKKTYVRKSAGNKWSKEEVC